MRSFGEVLAFLFLFVVMALVTALIIAVPVWLLWNWLIPVLFAGPHITLLQALGLSVLCGLLFKSSPSSRSSN